MTTQLQKSIAYFNIHLTISFVLLKKKIYVKSLDFNFYNLKSMEVSARII
jgi:hypothetical protein